MCGLVPVWDGLLYFGAQAFCLLLTSCMSTLALLHECVGWRQVNSTDREDVVHVQYVFACPCLEMIVLWAKCSRPNKHKCLCVCVIRCVWSKGGVGWEARKCVWTRERSDREREERDQDKRENGLIERTSDGSLEALLLQDRFYSSATSIENKKSQNHIRIIVPLLSLLDFYHGICKNIKCIASV